MSTTEHPPAPSGSAPQISDPQAQVPTPEAHRVEFPEVSGRASQTRLPLERFADIQIEVTVEIGKATLPIGELLRLGDGSVIELDRHVSEPVDLISKGTRIARGEVVVVDDRFALRIVEVLSDD